MTAVSSPDAFEALAYSSLLQRDLETSIEGGWIMDKRGAKRKLNHAVGRAKRQVEQWSDDAKDQVADAPRRRRAGPSTPGTR